jgi:hypothetical protein
MEKSIKKFLEFQGHQLYFSLINGNWLIAIKPICEALGVDYTTQHKQLQKDQMLSGVLALAPMHDTSGRIQKMMCLPEFYIYGWIFGINSQSKILLAYKWECYKVLFDHFHGAITQRSKLLNIKTKQQVEIERLEAKLQKSDDYIKLQKCRQQIKEVNYGLVMLDHDLIHGQLSIKFSNES